MVYLLSEYHVTGSTASPKVPPPYYFIFYKKNIILLEGSFNISVKIINIYAVGSKSFRPDQLFKVTEIKTTLLFFNVVSLYFNTLFN